MFFRIVDRGADVNISDGLPLYTSIYSGNLEITRYLLDLEKVPALNVNTYGWKQHAFCVMLISIELAAILMFLVLTVIWIIGLLDLKEKTPGGIQFDEENSISGDGSLLALNWMVIPAVCSLLIMYRLVPFHRLLMGIIAVKKEQRARKRNERESPV